MPEIQPIGMVRSRCENLIFFHPLRIKSELYNFCFLKCFLCNVHMVYTLVIRNTQRNYIWKNWSWSSLRKLKILGIFKLMFIGVCWRFCCSFQVIYIWNGSSYRHQSPVWRIRLAQRGRPFSIVCISGVQIKEKKAKNKILKVVILRKTR